MPQDLDDLVMYVLILGETGMRCDSEALRLQWEDVEFATGFIRVVSGRDGQNCDDSYTVSLAGANRASASAMEIVLRPVKAGNAADLVTFEDSGSQFTGIRFELRKDRPYVV